MAKYRSSTIPLILSAVFFLSVFTFRAAHCDNLPDYGDAFVVSSISDANNLVPVLAADSASSDVCGMVFNGLVK